MSKHVNMQESGWFAIAIIIAAGVAALWPGWAAAQSATSTAELQKEVAQLKRKVDKLEAENRQLKELSRQVEVIAQQLRVQQESAKKSAVAYQKSTAAYNKSAAEYQKVTAVYKKMPTIEAGSEGFFIRSQDRTYDLRIGGYMQADGDFYLSQTKPAGSQFLMRRVRPFLEGTVGEYYDFRIMEDFGQGSATLYDAYTDIHYWPELRLRAGKFKEPVGLERLEEARALKFVERALTVDLVPNRDLGAQLWGDLFSHRVTYAVGIFNGVPNNTASVDSDNNDAKDFDARIFLHPFADTSLRYARDLGFGIAGTYGDERGSTIDSYKSTGQLKFFTYASGVVASGARYRYVPQLDYYWGPFGLLSEYVVNNQRLLAPPTATNIHAGRAINAQAWQVAATYLLTGEDATYGQVHPRNDFSPFGHGIGAWELAARIDQLTIDRDAYKYGLTTPSASSLEATEYSMGVNWYLNRNVKLMVDYEHTGYRYGGKDGRDRPDESAILSEMQMQF
jgi:phosphate-selective porin OprO and OprP